MGFHGIYVRFIRIYTWDIYIYLGYGYNATKTWDIIHGQSLVVYKNGHLLLVMMMFYSQELEDFGSQLPIQGWG